MPEYEVGQDGIANQAAQAPGRLRYASEVSDFKSQHWLPAGYLKFFAPAGPAHGRGSRVWVSAGPKSFQQKVENLATSDYTYSASNPAGAEAAFTRMEDEYPRVMYRILGDPAMVKKSDQIRLLLISLHLHLRNVKYRLADGATGERIDAFKRWMPLTAEEEFGIDLSANTSPENQEILMREWVTSIISSAEELHTSDNPTLAFAEDDGRLAALLLPLTPSLVAISYRRSAVRVRSAKRATKTDARRLNSYTASQSINHVFSSAKPNRRDRERAHALRNKTSADHSMSTSTLEPAYLKPPSPPFSFATFLDHSE